MSSPWIVELAATIQALSPVDRVELFYAIGIRPSRHERMRARDAAILGLAVHFMPAVSSGRELARQLQADLARYAATAWRCERNQPNGPPDPLRSLMHTVLRCNKDMVPSFGTIRNVLAGIEP